MCKKHKLKIKNGWLTHFIHFVCDYCGYAYVVDRYALRRVMTGAAPIDEKVIYRAFQHDEKYVRGLQIMKGRKMVEEIAH